MKVGLVQRLIAEVSRGIGALRSSPRPGLRILMYHSIGDRRPDDRYGATVPVEAFVQQIRWLRDESGLALVSLPDGLGRLNSRTFSGTAVAITFDDGYLDTLTVAGPILELRGVPFTVFVVGDFLAHPPSPGAYLDAAALRELTAVPGALIGAHGQSHRPLTRLDDAALRAELRASAETLAHATGRRPTMMSYPHGVVDERVARFAADAGFGAGATSLLGVNVCGASSLRLRRTEVTAADTLASFIGKVRGDYDWYQIKQRLYWPLPAA